MNATVTKRQRLSTQNVLAFSEAFDALAEGNTDLALTILDRSELNTSDVFQAITKYLENNSPKEEK